MSGPVRIQRKRTKGWRMPENTVSVSRPGKWGNPFSVGGYFLMGDPDPSKAGAFRMIWCEARPEYADDKFTLIKTAKQAVEWYRRLTAKHPPHGLEELRGKNLACWCPLNQPCHADVLLELANAPLPGQTSP
jgi:uncharacterized protein DUF4326